MLIYKITNKLNNKCYIGSTNSFDRRKREHIISAYSDKYDSYNYPLQRALRKYGADNFTFEILEDGIPKRDIATKEYNYILKFDCLSTKNRGYNQTLFTECALRDPYYIKKFIEKNSSKCAEVDKNNNILCEYESLHAAARLFATPNSASKIKAVCDGKANATNGRIFRYIIDNKVIVPEQLTRPRRQKICGISIYNANDIVIYDSVSEAARIENAERASIQKCIAGKERYSYVHKRIWRKYSNGEIIKNKIDIENIIKKHKTRLGGG